MHKIIVTPQQRSLLAELTMHRSLNVKGAEQRKLYRLRKAFGLFAACQWLIDKQQHSAKLRVSKERQLVEVDGDVLAYAIELYERLDVSAAVGIVLGPVFEQLDAAKDGKLAHEGELPERVNEDAEDWAPDRLRDEPPNAWFAAAMEDCKTWDTFREKYLSDLAAERGQQN